jgi:hypothetical protein
MTKAQIEFAIFGCVNGLKVRFEVQLGAEMIAIIRSVAVEEIIGQSPRNRITENRSQSPNRLDFGHMDESDRRIDLANKPWRD